MIYPVAPIDLESASTSSAADNPARLGQRQASPVAVSGASYVEGRPTRGGRKRKTLDLTELSECLCGVHAVEGESGLIVCGASGCETRRVSNYDSAFYLVLTCTQFHLDCVGLERVTRGWVCNACKAKKRRK